MPLSRSLPLFLSTGVFLISSPTAEAGRVKYIGRPEPFGETSAGEIPEFVPERLETPRRLMWFGGGKAWIIDAVTGSGVEVGLRGTPEFTSTSDGRSLQGARLADFGSTLVPSGHAFGLTVRFNGSTRTGYAAWEADAVTGATTRLGLFSGAEFTRSSDLFQHSDVDSFSSNGHAMGRTQRFAGSTEAGVAAWISDANTGISRRVGLFEGAEFTRASDGFQFSLTPSLSLSTSITTAGGGVGISRRFNGDADAGTAVWTAKAQTGVTTRTGLFTGPEFTRSSDQYQDSEIQWMTEGGYAGGFSRQYVGTAEAGAGVWVVNANTGITHRVGFYSAPEYTRAVDGIQGSSLSWITSAGQAIGMSTKFMGDLADSTISWVADANTGITIRAGLPIPGEGETFKHSLVFHLTESGYSGGEASRDEGSRAAWVMRISTQESIRAGLLEPGVFVDGDGYSSSLLEMLKESGRSGGYSLIVGGGGWGQAAWVTDAFPGAARRVGLHGEPAYTGRNGLQMSSVKLLTESGISAGTSALYIRDLEAGQASWVCHPSTGISTRIGLFVASEFNLNSFGAHTVVDKLTESGLVFGTSTRRFSVEDEAPWIASAVTGVTTALGLSDSVHTALDNHRSGVTDTRFLDRGYVTGYSDRYHKNAGTQGATAWLYDAGTGLQTNFELSVRPSDGYAWSKILGISPEGIAYGTYGRINGEVSVEGRAFLWSRNWGTVDLAGEVSGGIGQFGWRKFEFVHSALGNGLFLGSGETTTGESGIFVVQAGGELPGLTHRQGWERQYFSPGDEPGDSQDTDGDGIPDGLEYAWGFSPLAPDAMERGLAVLPGPDAGEPMALSFRRNPLATGIRYTLEASSDFITWTPLAESSDGQTAAGTGFLREEEIPGESPFLTVFVRDPADPDPAGKRFARLRVTR